MSGPEEGGQGVRVYAPAGVPPETQALRQLEAIARLPWVAAPVVALPDLHWKERLETPSSTATATAEHLVPSLSSPSQNCGMNLLRTPLREEDLTPDRIDRLMDALRDGIPRRRRDPVVEDRDVLRFCLEGAPAAAVRFGLDPSVCATIEDGGNVLSERTPPPDEMESILDRDAVRAGRTSFAFIGGGNHFLELQVVSEILDAAACRAMGLEPGAVVAMFHTGSERLGHDLGRLYSWRRKTDPRRRRGLFWRKVKLHLARDVRGLDDVRRRWRFHIARRDHAPVPAGSREGRKLLLSLQAAANYGYANRVAVTALIRDALRRATGSQDLDLGIVADLSHNTIRRERLAGRDLWVHRHNAARVVGPAGLPAHHPYAAIGQPVMVPGTSRTSSFVLVGRDGAAASLFSVDHGAGRTVERFEQSGRLTARPGVTLKYTYRSRAPERQSHLSDEGIEAVAGVASAAGLAVPAARLRPVAVLKA